MLASIWFYHWRGPIFKRYANVPKHTAEKLPRTFFCSKASKGEPFRKAPNSEENGHRTNDWNAVGNIPKWDESSVRSSRPSIDSRHSLENSMDVFRNLELCYLLPKNVGRRGTVLQISEEFLLRSKTFSPRNENHVYIQDVVKERRLLGSDRVQTLLGSRNQGKERSIPLKESNTSFNSRIPREELMSFLSPCPFPCRFREGHMWFTIRKSSWMEALEI